MHQKFSVEFVETPMAVPTLFRVAHYTIGDGKTRYFATARSYGFGPDRDTPKQAIRACVAGDVRRLRIRSIAEVAPGEHDDPTSCEYLGPSPHDLHVEEEALARLERADETAMMRYRELTLLRREHVARFDPSVLRRFDPTEALDLIPHAYIAYEGDPAASKPVILAVFWERQQAEAFARLENDQVEAELVTIDPVPLIDQYGFHCRFADLPTIAPYVENTWEIAA